VKQPDLSPTAPWKQRFRAWVVALASVASREPARGIVTANKSGVHQIYAWDVPTGNLRQLTFTEAGKIMASLSPDGRYVYYLHDEQGNEIGHAVRVPYEGGDPEDITPDLPPYASGSTAMSRDGGTLTVTTATREGFHTYVIALGADGALGERRLLYHTTPLMQGVTLSHDGRLAVFALTERSKSTDTDLAAFETASSQRIADLADEGASVRAVRFSRVRGDERVLCSTTRGGQTRPLIWSPRIGKRVDYDFADVSGEVMPVDWSEDANRLLLMQVHAAVQNLVVYDIDTGELRWLDHPSGSIVNAHFAPDGEVYALINDATRPPRVIALDDRTGAEKRVLLRGEDVPSGTPWRSVTYDSTNGARIQAWLATPPGGGPYPTILNVHGGPTAVQMESFSPRTEAWLDHGFAFFSINYRGSTTFGREFEKSIHGRLGDLETEDIAAAHRWLIGNGVAKPDQVFLSGGSYGGYLTLLGVGRLPALWAGGMALVAIADWVLMYEDQAETLRRYQMALFGGTPDELPEQHARSSPITYASDVKAPLLIIQGSNDTRCPARQMRVYEEKMRELGKDIEVLWFDAGHGSYAIEQNIEHTERMLEFAHRVLESRA
jgi:dipeptidyl aminopeptidase/acylaminoacyl peptidase